MLNNIRKDCVKKLLHFSIISLHPVGYFDLQNKNIHFNGSRASRTQLRFIILLKMQYVIFFIPVEPLTNNVALYCFNYILLLLTYFFLPENTLFAFPEKHLYVLNILNYLLLVSFSLIFQERYFGHYEELVSDILFYLRFLILEYFIKPNAHYTVKQNL